MGYNISQTPESELGDNIHFSSVEQIIDELKNAPNLCCNALFPPASEEERGNFGSLWTRPTKPMPLNGGFMLPVRQNPFNKGYPGLRAAFYKIVGDIGVNTGPRVTPKVSCLQFDSAKLEIFAHSMGNRVCSIEVDGEEAAAFLSEGYENAEREANIQALIGKLFDRISNHGVTSWEYDLGTDFKKVRVSIEEEFAYLRRVVVYGPFTTEGEMKEWLTSRSRQVVPYVAPPQSSVPRGGVVASIEDDRVTGLWVGKIRAGDYIDPHSFDPVLFEDLLEGAADVFCTPT